MPGGDCRPDGILRYLGCKYCRGTSRLLNEADNAIEVYISSMLGITRSLEMSILWICFIDI